VGRGRDGCCCWVQHRSAAAALTGRVEPDSVGVMQRRQQDVLVIPVEVLRGRHVPQAVVHQRAAGVAVVAGLVPPRKAVHTALMARCRPPTRAHVALVTGHEQLRARVHGRRDRLCPRESWHGLAVLQHACVGVARLQCLAPVVAHDQVWYVPLSHLPLTLPQLQPSYSNHAKPPKEPAGHWAPWLNVQAFQQLTHREALMLQLLGMGHWTLDLDLTAPHGALYIQQWRVRR
jgi:hypothetical protein